MQSANFRILEAYSRDPRRIKIADRMRRAAESRTRQIHDELRRVVLNVNVSGVTRPGLRSRRIEVLYDHIGATLGRGVITLEQEMLDGAQQITLASIERYRRIINSAVGFPILTGPVDVPESSTLSISGTYFTGAEGWIDRGRMMMLKRVVDTVRLGLGLEEQDQAIASRVNSLRKNSSHLLGRVGFAMGRAADAAASRALCNSHPQAISSVQQVSVNDGSSTSSNVCRALGGLTWSVPHNAAIGHKHGYAGGVPRHFGCRSFETPVLHAFAEMQLLPGGFGEPTESVGRRAARQGLSAEDLRMDLDGKLALSRSMRAVERKALLRKGI